MKKGDMWHDDKHVWLITDVTKKKKDDYRLYDDDWNDAKVGTKFIYAVNVHDYCTTQARERYDTLRPRMKFLAKCKKCTCPKCELYHPAWGLYYQMLKKELNEH